MHLRLSLIGFAALDRAALPMQRRFTFGQPRKNKILHTTSAKLQQLTGWRFPSAQARSPTPRIHAGWRIQLSIKRLSLLFVGQLFTFSQLKQQVVKFRTIHSIRVTRPARFQRACKSSKSHWFKLFNQASLRWLATLGAIALWLKCSVDR